MPSPLKLGRELDLRNPSEREEFVHAVIAQPGTSQHSPSEVKDALEMLAALFPSADWLKVSPYLGGSLQVEVGLRRTTTFPLDNAVTLGLQLKRLKNCEGFDMFVRAFNNPPQFFDSVFEASMADYCLARSKALKFSPAYLVRGKWKHPDFELETTFGTIVCECKSLSESDREYSKRLADISQAFNAAAKTLGGVPQGYRLEVHIRGPVRGNLNKMAKEVCDTALHCIADVGKVFETGPFKFCLVLQNSPVRFADTGIYHQSIIVGDTPVGLSPEYAYLRVTTERIDRSRIKASGDLIREAKAQLPDDEMCVAFIEVMNSPSAEQAAHERLKTKDYQHLLAVGISSSYGLRFVYRLSDREKVEGVFGPLQSDK